MVWSGSGSGSIELHLLLCGVFVQIAPGIYIDFMWKICIGTLFLSVLVHQRYIGLLNTFQYSIFRTFTDRRFSYKF